MKARKITLLNSSILTAHGEYSYSPITLSDALRIVREAFNVESAIGHASTAAILTDLLEFPIDQNRIEYQQQPGEAALVFKLARRPPEGSVLSREEIERIGYEFAELYRSK